MYLPESSVYSKITRKKKNRAQRLANIAALQLAAILKASKPCGL